MDRRHLTDEERERIADYDRDICQSWGSQAKRTRFYKFLVADGDDMEVRTVAVRYGNGNYATRKLFIKEVVWASAISDRMYIRDLGYAPMAGYRVDWSREGLMSEPYWRANGWFGTAYDPGSPMWKFRDKPVINREELANHPRFKYCRWSPTCGDIIDYLKVYQLHPKVELLVKAGLKHLACRRGFLSQLEKNKGLMQFVAANIAEIAEIKAGCDAILKAKKDGTTVAQAKEMIDTRREFQGCHLPREIDAGKALAYLKAQKSYIGKSSYAHYINVCRTLGLDLADTKVAFPKKFEARRVEVDAAMEALKRKNDLKKRREMNKAIADVAIDLARLEKVNGPFAVVLPKKETDLNHEGRKLSHCVGNGRYAERIALRELAVAFIRRKSRRSEPFVTVSVDLTSRQIAQCYAYDNDKPEKRVMDFVNGPFARAVKKIKVG